MRRVATAAFALAAPALALLAPAGALAHAQLEGTSPERGAVVKHEPAAVIFRFDEPVEGNFGAVRVYDANGDRVDEGDAFHPTAKARGSASTSSRACPTAATPPPTGSSPPTATSSPAASSSRSARPAGRRRRRSPQLTSGSGSGPVTETAFGIARGLQYAAIALAVGGLAFLLLAWLPALAAVGGDGEAWSRAARAFAARLRAVAAPRRGARRDQRRRRSRARGGRGGRGLRLLGPQGDDRPRDPGNQVRDDLGPRGAGLGRLRAARRGAGAARRRALASAWAGPCSWRCRSPSSSWCRRSPATAAPSRRSPSTSRSTSSTSPRWRSGSAAWRRCSSSCRGATRELEPGDRGRLLAAALSRFSRVALISVGAILLTGLVQAYVYVRHLDALIETGYGRAVLVKFLLLMVLIGIGAYNRRRSVPRLNRIAAGGESPGRAGLLLRRALRAEVALLVVVHRRHRRAGQLRAAGLRPVGPVLDRNAPSARSSWR